MVVLSDNLVLGSGPGAPILRAPILCFLNQIFEPEIFFRKLPLAEHVAVVFKAPPSHLPTETYHILAHAIRADRACLSLFHMVMASLSVTLVPLSP